MVTEGNTLRYFDEEELIAEVPADSLILGGGAPVYEREYKRAGLPQRDREVRPQ